MPGLKFQKLDLHTHTPASKCYLDKTHTPTQIVQAALDRGLAAIAITDHNTAEWIDRMKEAAQGANLVVFPGVEISMDQFHVVALFDPTISQKEVENFLGALDIKAEEYGKSETICPKNITEALEIIHKRNGLAILAHIDTNKGAFYEQVKIREDGKPNIPQAVRKLFNDSNYYAVECVNGKLPNGFDSEHQFTRFPAVYQASDNPDPDDDKKHSLKGIGKRYSWFKLDQIDIEGLRQCFADPEVRIHLMDQPSAPGAACVVSMQVGEEGFLRNQKFVFHEGLNSIIGGKGVGKSLAIEFLRFGLFQPPSDEVLLADHNSKLEKRLGIGNTVSVVYKTAEGTSYRIERQIRSIRKGGQVLTEATCTNLETGELYRGDIPSLLPVLAYSQTEVIKIAENKNAQLQLIDRFIDPRPHEQAIDDLRARLEQNDQRFHGAIMARDRFDSIQKELDTLKTRVEIINRTLDNPLFQRMKEAESKRALFDKRYNYVNALIEEVRSWNDQVKSNVVDGLSDEEADQADLVQTQQIAEQARLDTSQSLVKIIVDLGKHKAAISDVIMDWMPQFDRISNDYKELLHQIGGDRKVQEQERKRLNEQISEYERQAREAQALLKYLENILIERNDLLNQLERAYFAYYETREAKYTHLTELSENKLRLDLQHAANREEYENRLVGLLRGGASPITTSDRQKIAQNVMPRRLIQLVLDRNVLHLANEAGISELWAERVIEKLWSAEDFTQVLALQHNCFPADVPSIRFRKDSRTYDELSELSIGQKCTALLIIALCDGAMPVIIDQPEDALDIASVWEDIAKKLRRGKETRQFILTTHNSSVAVGSDSDQFIVLKAGSVNGRVIYTGAIDRQEVRESVIQHLEGGDEPYKLRARKYNIQ